MISEITPTMVLHRRTKHNRCRTMAERALWIINSHKRRLADYTIRSDVRTNLEREITHWQNKLKELQPA